MAVHLAQRLSQEAKRKKADEWPFAGLILQSPLESTIRVISRPISFVASDMFKNVRKISSVTRPVLICHGTDDCVVPYSHGEELASQCSEKNTLWNLLSLEGAGHNDIEARYFDPLVENIRGFVSFLMDGGSPPIEQANGGG